MGPRETDGLGTADGEELLELHRKAANNIEQWVLAVPDTADMLEAVRKSRAALGRAERPPPCYKDQLAHIYPEERGATGASSMSADGDSGEGSSGSADDDDSRVPAAGAGASAGPAVAARRVGGSIRR